MRIGRIHDVVTAEPLVSPVPAAASAPAAPQPGPADPRRAEVAEPGRAAAPVAPCG